MQCGVSKLRATSQTPASQHAPRASRGAEAHAALTPLTHTRSCFATWISGRVTRYFTVSTFPAFAAQCSGDASTYGWIQSAQHVAEVMNTLNRSHSQVSHSRGGRFQRAGSAAASSSCQCDPLLHTGARHSPQTASKKDESWMENHGASQKQEPRTSVSASSSTSMCANSTSTVAKWLFFAASMNGVHQYCEQHGRCRVTPI